MAWHERRSTEADSSRRSLRSEGRAAHPVGDALRAHATRSSTPLHVTVELTQRCNLRCVHCYVTGTGSGLPPARLVELVGELGRANCLAVTLTGGEPTLYPEWERVAEAVRNEGMLLSMLTNGTLLTERDLDVLGSLRPSLVAVSVYGPTAEIHDSVTGSPGSFDRALAALRGLTARGIRARMGTVLMDLNAAHMGAIAELADELGCGFMVDPSPQPRDDGSLDPVLLRVHGELLAEVLERQLQRVGDGLSPATSVPTAARSAANCGAGRTSAFVTADGDVLPCMGFPPAFGNLEDSSFEEIWRGSVAVRFREQMQETLHGCAECDWLQRCTVRCPRLAAIEDGDALGQSARACEIVAQLHHLETATVSKR